MNTEGTETYIERIIVTHLNKRWPHEKKTDILCDCNDERGYPLMLWGVTTEGELCSMCPGCKEFQWGQTYEDD